MRVVSLTAAVALSAIVGTPPLGALRAVDPLDLVKQGRKLNTEGKQAEALALYRQALQLSPELFDAHLGAGIALDLMGEYAEARRHLGKAIEVAPDDSKDQALAMAAVSYAFEGKTKESSAFYRQVFDRQTMQQNLSGAAATANALGRMYLESGDLDNALKWYQTGYETIRRQPDLPGSEIDLWEMRWAHAQGRIAARRKNAAEARRETAAVKALLDKGTNQDERVQYPYLAGYVNFYLKDYPGAIAELRKADEHDPFILALLAQAYEKAGDRAKARECYELVLASNAHSLNNAFARPLAKKKLSAGR